MAEIHLQKFSFNDYFEKRRARWLHGWGDWHYCGPNHFLEPSSLVIYYEGTKNIQYAIDLARCKTSGEVLDWIFQLETKNWMTPQRTKDFLRALSDVLDPQATLCSFGTSREIADPEELAFRNYRAAISND